MIPSNLLTLKSRNYFLVTKPKSYHPLSHINPNTKYWFPRKHKILDPPQPSREDSEDNNTINEFRRVARKEELQRLTEKGVAENGRIYP